jgi:hypothetical protein
MNQQLRDTKAQMQGAMQEGLKETMPEMQQQRMKGRMNQQVQDMQKGVLENLAPGAPQPQDKDQ